MSSPQRKDRAWMARWLQDRKALIDAGDPYAQKLLQYSRGVVMPAVPGMNPTVANDLIDLIESESKLPKSRFAGSQISDRPFTPNDIAAGRQIFTGTKRLTGGHRHAHAAGGVLADQAVETFEFYAAKQQLMALLRGQFP